MRKIQIWGLMGLTLILSGLTGCAQARQGLGAGSREVQMWAPQQLCTNQTGSDTLACVDIALNITDNLAEINVLELGFDPGQTPYRVYARRAGDGQFVQLADNVTVTAGGTFQVSAKSNHYIEEYEEWIIEIAAAYDSNGMLAEAAPLQGIIAARAIIDWPELYQ